ncbi:cysteine desulfurase [Mariprofundus ferrinatatus]|uniref:cysteine desulfurase n=1 Tax=Mariprofundus ferrinatatus TaxID=1921087 RepID=A0A2K8L251_9PROT|nr:cysteine desulfurase family protein [Mariprofundus ferrinatatus]ATX81172.1 cysteine desulfurase [Mariprofundus ferrinatatus]
MHRYLDCNATYPQLPISLEAMVQAATAAPGNPSSLHWAGRAARRIVDDARDTLAAFVGAELGSVVYTSGGTEANNIAIHSVLSTANPGRIVTTAIEHPAILNPLETFVAANPEWELVKLRPNRDGVVTADSVEAAINDETRLLCMMYANNESGALQPVEEVAALCRNRSIPMLVDAVQMLGKGRLRFNELGIDFMSISAHKIGGPKGVGALLVRRGVRLKELTPGGGQERGRRSGTENVPAIAGFSAALGQLDFSVCRPVRDLFEAELVEKLPYVEVVSQCAVRTPNTSLVILPGLDGETLLMQLDLAGFAVASGSACSSGKREPSHVLLGMGYSELKARSSLRVSFAPDSSREDALALVEALVGADKRLKGMAGITA